jgi:integrase
MRPRKQQRDLPACLYHKHGAYWLVKRGKWTRLGASKKAALERYANLTDSPKGEMPALIEAALESMLPKVSASTRRQYQAAGRKLAAMLVEFSPEQVQQRDVAAIKVALKDTPNMANRCLSVLRQVFAYALEQQLVGSNPCIGIERHVEAKRTRYLTDAELIAIRAHSGSRLSVIVDLCYLTGQRIGDVLAIRRADLTADGIRFRQAKTSTSLTVAWTPDLEATVAEAKALHRNIVALTLLHNRRGKSPDYRTVRDQWDKACKAAGVEDAHLHDLRAKSLTDAKREGQDATALAGHVSAAMTARYIRLRESPVVHGPSIRQALDK